MSGTQPSAARSLPRPVQLKDGTPVVLRLMTPGDAASIAAFARSLPEDDLLFLRMDITDPDAVAHWMRNLEAGLTTTVIAEAGGSIAGYAALVQNRVACYAFAPRVSAARWPGRSSRSHGRAASARSWPR
jgi:hypothetical protein